MNILSALYSGKWKFLKTRDAIKERVEELEELIQAEESKKLEADSGLDSSISNTKVYESSKPSRR